MLSSGFSWSLSPRHVLQKSQKWKVILKFSKIQQGWRSVYIKWDTILDFVETELDKCSCGSNYLNFLELNLESFLDTSIKELLPTFQGSQNVSNLITVSSLITDL